MSIWQTNRHIFLFIFIIFSTTIVIFRFNLHRQPVNIFQTYLSSHCLRWQSTNHPLSIRYSCSQYSQIQSIIWTHNTSGLIKYIQWIVIRKLSNIRITHFDDDCLISHDYHYHSIPSNDEFIQIFVIPLSANFTDQSKCPAKFKQIKDIYSRHIYFTRKSIQATLFYQQLDTFSFNQKNFSFHFNHSLTKNLHTIFTYFSTRNLISLYEEDFVHFDLDKCENKLRYLFSLLKLNQSQQLIEYDSHRFISDGTWWDHSQVAEHIINNTIPIRSTNLTYLNDFYYLYGQKTFIEYLYDNRHCYRQGIFTQIQSEIKPNRTSTDVPNRCLIKGFDCAFSDIYSFSDREQIYENKEFNTRSLKCGLAISSIFDQVRKRYARNQTCQTIVFTSITNCYDTLPEVNGKILPSFCFIALLDNKTVNAYKKIYADKTILPWDLINLGPVATPFSIEAKTSETVKIVGEHLFPLAKWIIWLDGKGRMNNIDELLIQAQAPFIGAPYPDDGRASASEVSPTIGRISSQEQSSPFRLKNSIDDIQLQEKQYEREEFYKRSDELKLKMYDIAVCLYRNNQPCISRYLCGWHNEINYYSYRGQLSVYYSAVRFNLTKYLAIVEETFYTTVGHRAAC